MPSIIDFASADGTIPSPRIASPASTGSADTEVDGAAGIDGTAGVDGAAGLTTGSLTVGLPGAAGTEAATGAATGVASVCLIYIIRKYYCYSIKVNNRCDEQ